MRHLNLGRKLNRTKAHRRALFKNMFLALVKSSRITTTDQKAKELRRFADRMVTLGKKGDLAARRRAFSYLQSHQAVKKLFDEIAPRYKDRAGGYTRVVKFGFRRGDAAQLSIIEFTGLEGEGADSQATSPQEGRRGRACRPSARRRQRLALHHTVRHQGPRIARAFLFSESLDNQIRVAMRRDVFEVPILRGNPSRHP